MLWRDSARTPRLGPIDARAAWAMLIFILHISEATALLVLAVVIVLWLIERRGYTPDIALRVLRLKAAGRVRPVLDKRQIVSSEYWQRRTWGIK